MRLENEGVSGLDASNGGDDVSTQNPQTRWAFVRRPTSLLVVGLMLIGGLAYVKGINPVHLLGFDQRRSVEQSAAQTTQERRVVDSCANNAANEYSCQVLASVNETWAKAFPPGKYQATRLLFYTREGQSGCGTAQSAMGPFYCPADQGIYLDTAFYDELSKRMSASADYAQAYVIAHEVGHHIQYLTGITDQIRRYQARASKEDSERLQVALELQADCYAGIWAARNKERIELGNLEDGLRAAHHIGKDSLKSQAKGRVVPESFSYGSINDRTAWLKRGFDRDDPDACDPFQTVRLKS